MGDVELDLSEGVLVCRLNRPDAGNGLTGPLLRALVTAFEEAGDNDRVRVVVTIGAGRQFSVGADLGDITEPPAGVTLDDLYHQSYGDRPGGPDPLGPGRPSLAIRTCPKPTIAAVNGAAAGGGFALALLHDFRIASTRARFTTSFIHLGLVAEMGLSHTLPRVVGPEAAMDIFLTGRIVEADEALALGLVRRVVEPSELEAAALEYAARLAAQPPHAVQLVKRTLLEAWDTSFLEQLELEWPRQVEAFAGEEARRAIDAFLERRQASARERGGSGPGR